MATEAVIKKWGNSFGIIFPKNFVESNNLKLNDKIIVDVVKKAEFKRVFGSLKAGMSGQNFKNMVRKGWD